MNSLYFQNAGYFDPRAMLTAGVSAKESPTAIGFFGTGFKYAAAIILRLGGHIDITTTTDDGVTEYYRFHKEAEQIRGEEFDLVKVEKRTSADMLQPVVIDAGFTTRLGLQWEPWMAYRELRCNATDEGGRVGTDLQDGFQTTVAVTCPPLLDVHGSRDDYFIDDDPPIYSTPDVDIHRGGRSFMYYRGVAVHNCTPSAFSYNIKAKIELSEERTARSGWQISEIIQKALQSVTNRDICRAVLRSDSQYDQGIGFKGSDMWGDALPVSDEFREEAYQALKTGTLKNQSARRMLEQIRDKEGTWEPMNPTKVQAEMLGRALRFLGAMGFPIRDFPIRLVLTLGEGVMGRAHKDQIYMAELAFTMGTKQVASTLLEEWVHLKHGHADFDRGMQNWLFDTILSLGENINGEPL